MIDDPDDAPDSGAPSKSARKRDAHALQDLGEELIAAPDELLDRLGLPERLADAIREARRITSRGARVRQRQFIGKLMRGIDPTPVRAALAALGEVDRVEAARFRRIEQWRDRLLTEGDAALTALLTEYPSAPRALLAALAGKAIDERARGRPPAAARELFRALRDLLARDDSTRHR
ncbi:MAG: ribosome biogenesis factor YjgA [Steroidobacteraceae bacterium]